MSKSLSSSYFCACSKRNCCRENTVLSYLKRNKLGKFNTEEMAKLDAEKAKQEAEKAAEMEQDKKMAEGIKLGDR